MECWEYLSKEQNPKNPCQKEWLFICKNIRIQLFDLENWIFFVWEKGSSNQAPKTYPLVFFYHSIEAAPHLATKMDDSNVLQGMDFPDWRILKVPNQPFM